MSFNEALIFAVAAILGAAYLAGKWVQASAVVDCCCEPGDFDRWQAELDSDDTEPALVVPTPVSDEHLLDVWNATRDPEVAR